MPRYDCYYCGLNARVETWFTLIGERYVDLTCGATGYMTDKDAPRLVDDEDVRHRIACRGDGRGSNP